MDDSTLMGADKWSVDGFWIRKTGLFSFVTSTSFLPLFKITDFIFFMIFHISLLTCNQYSSKELLEWWHFFSCWKAKLFVTQMMAGKLPGEPTIRQESCLYWVAPSRASFYLHFVLSKPFPWLLRKWSHEGWLAAEGKCRTRCFPLTPRDNFSSLASTFSVSVSEDFIWSVCFIIIVYSHFKRWKVNSLVFLSPYDIATKSYC